MKNKFPGFALLVLQCILTVPSESSAGVLVASNSTWRYFKGTSEASTPTNAWRELDFDDSAWPTGAAPFHYGTNAMGGDDALTGGTILHDMRGQYTCVFLRKTFFVADTNNVRTLPLNLWSDDGVAIWINGRLARAPFSVISLAHDSRASFGREAFGFAISLDEALPFLRSGTNVLCLQAFNVGLFDDDFQIEAELLSAKATLSFTNIPPSVSETNSQVVLRVVRSGDLTVESTVAWRTEDGTAMAGQDYVARSGILRFAPGQDVHSIVVPILNDGWMEGIEAFTIVLSDADEETWISNPRRVSINIDDNDFGIVLEGSLFFFDENIGNATVFLRRVGDPLEEVMVEWSTEDATALAGLDYVASGGTVRFAVGEVRKPVVIPIINDGLVEGLETFLIRLVAVTGGSGLGNLRQAVVQIRDNDFGISFDQSTFEVAEESESLRVIVRRNDDSPNPASVMVAAVDGSAQMGVDYELITTNVTFSPGQKTGEIAVRIIDDLIPESSEAFSLRLIGVTGDASLGVVTTAVVTIASSDFRTLHVRLDSPNPSPPYLTWATAARVIQDAVDLAGEGDTVLVTNGIYSVGSGALIGGERSRVVLTNAIRLRSVNGAAQTIIVGSVNPGGDPGPASVRCVYLGQSASLSGFTLTNGHARSGGGAWCHPSAVVFDCIFSGNFSEDGGGAAGGTITDSTFIANLAALYGGGADSSVLRRCTIIGNRAGDGGGAARSILHGCVLSGNSAFERLGFQSAGGAFECSLYNCTVTGNSAIEGGGTMWSYLYNSIVQLNDASILGNYDGCTFEYSCTDPLPPGPGNIDLDPRLMNAAAGDFRLRSDSPCIDSGIEMSVLLVTDVAGVVRPLDGNGDGVAKFDMGAHEFRPYGFAPTLRLSSAGFHFIIRGEPGTSARVERSRDLRGWESVVEITLPAVGEALMEDSAVGGEPRLFYRVISIP